MYIKADVKSKQDGKQRENVELINDFLMDKGGESHEMGSSMMGNILKDKLFVDTSNINVVGNPTPGSNTNSNTNTTNKNYLSNVTPKNISSNMEKINNITNLDKKTSPMEGNIVLNKASESTSDENNSKHPNGNTLSYDQSNFQRDLNSSQKNRESFSLNFLRKPRRNTQFNKDRIPDDVLQRNTDLNKQITIELPALSPKSTIQMGTDKFNNINYTLTSAANLNDYTNYNSSTDSLLAFPTPVYKKSGELVKSSLKRRSKSLPSTPAANNSDDENEIELDPPRLLRSKSVHFDQRAPVKYFISDESPMNVYTKNEFEDILRFSLLNNNENDILSQFNNLVHEEKERLLKTIIRKRDDSDSTLPSGTGTTNGKSTKLRRSKRFQNITNSATNSTKNINNEQNGKIQINSDILSNSKLKNKVINIPSNATISVNTNDLKNAFNKLKIQTNNSIRTINSPPQQNINNNSNNSDTKNNSNNYPQNTAFNGLQNKPNGNSPFNVRKIGLYNPNFPVLNSKNPQSLKLNIFVNLSKDMKVFLQDISLHIHQRKFVSPNLHTMSPMTNTTRYIIGKVLVKNIFFDKRVIVRYTWNQWKTISEVECIWLSNGDGILPGTNMDIFQFLIDDTNKIDYVGKLEFCIHYTTRDDMHREEYWDNNDTKNYRMDVVMNGFNDKFQF